MTLAAALMLNSSPIPCPSGDRDLDAGDPLFPVGGDGEFAFVMAAVMGIAAQDQVVQAGFAAVDPVRDVMGLASGGWLVAVEVMATLVAEDEGAARAPSDSTARFAALRS